MTKYHANGCGGVLAVSGYNWKCSKCGCYTNEVADTKEEALA